MSSGKKPLLTIIGIVVIVIIIGIVYLSLRAPQQGIAARDLQEIKEEGILRVATTYNPLGYYVESDTIAGFNHSLIKLLQSTIDLRIETIVMSDIKSMTEALSNNKCDIVIANIPITNPIKDSLSFTKPITLNKLVLVQRKQSFNDGKAPVRSLLELARCSIHVASHSPAIIRIENLAREIGDSIYYIEDKIYSNEQLAMKVSSGEIDFSVIDENTARKMSKELPEIDCETEIGFTHLEAWALRSSSPILLDSVNQWIDKIKGNREYSKIYRKYYK